MYVVQPRISPLDFSIDMTNTVVEMSATQQLLHHHSHHFGTGHCTYRSSEEDLGYGASKDSGHAGRLAEINA